jgi:hypothetical protein
MQSSAILVVMKRRDQQMTFGLAAALRAQIEAEADKHGRTPGDQIRRDLIDLYEQRIVDNQERPQRAA